MAATKSVTKSVSATGTSIDNVQTLSIGNVYAGPELNSRTMFVGDATDPDNVKDENKRGWVNNLFDVARTALKAGAIGEPHMGQRDPIVVRHNPNYGKQGTTKNYLYLTVSGFGRVLIMQTLAQGGNEYRAALTDPKKGALTQAQVDSLKTNDPKVRAFVKSYRSDAEAFEETLTENVQRDDISTQDLIAGVLRLIALNPSYTDEELAIKVNRAQSYVSRARRIGEAMSKAMLPAGWAGGSEPSCSVLEAWRKDQAQRPTVQAMVDMADDSDMPDKALAYMVATKRVTPAGEVVEEPALEKGPKAWTNNACNVYVPRMARFLIALKRAGHLNINDKDIEGVELLTSLFKHLKFPIGKEITEDNWDQVAGAFKKALVTAAKEAKEAAMAAANPTTEGEDVPKGKGKRAAANGATA